MHPFLRWLRTHHMSHDCMSTRLRLPPSIACSVRRPKGSTFYVLDCDRCSDFLKGQGRGRKRPDFLLFLERQGRLLIVVLEVTGGREVEPDKGEQIEHGLQILEEYLNADPGFIQSLDCEAFILHSGRVRTDDIRRLRRPFNFRRKALSPVVDRCGRLLNELLMRWPKR